MSKKILNEEVTFEDVGVQNRPIISKTNLKGIITFVNTPFCKLSGYSKEEVLGKPHNIIRHPDMPKKVFKELWDTIEKNQKWRGFVKNLRKDGKYYWIEVHIEPIFDDNGIKIGYIATRKPVSDEDKKKYEKIYAKMKQKEEL
ncbi:PAS domain-containing protein [Caminibacter mediatlanticus]|uniref:Aerotaxis sensor receptor (Aer-like) protein n=1 Tax=Caminibacter mediatlanticus TB-2 TaxID=391592 RepID=A0AAI9AHW5_9BACT|nr:PAS sensor domain-containing protein [Caminibacter mediatlanticus]EDM23905.1 putative aerotaxis sensor receptor (Aer-like) protein [Caminibacter mediatlanticus TB-2]